MRALLTLSIAGLMLLSLAALASGATSTIGIGDIKPGMKGYGMTVFRGTRPERFDVEVIDVLHNFRPSQDLILVRTHHPILEKAIVVGGMSGSPIYFDGKLAGAYAYGWLFGKEPLAGVTPIANMMKELHRPIDPELWKGLGTLPRKLGPRVFKADTRRRSTRRLAGLPPYLGQQRHGAFGALHKHAEARGYDGKPREGAFAATTPLMLSGLEERSVAMLAGELERFGLVPLQAGAGGSAKPGSDHTREQFVDGGAIGVQLIRGDINATAIGTVTHVEGERLIAFGHPMMNAGQPALPTAVAKVLHVFASQRRSFKMGYPIKSLGTMVHDRQSAIVIDTTYEADTVPLRLRLHGAEGAPRTEWNMEIASQRMLTPMLTFSAIFNAVNATLAERADVVFEADTRVELERHGVIHTRDFGYSSGGLANPMALSSMRMFDTIGAAYGNPFEDVRVLGMEVDLKVRFDRDVLVLVDALVSSTEVDPGSDVNVYLTTRRFGEPDQTRIVRVPVPESAAGEKIELVFEPGNRVKLQLPRPDDMATILDNVRAGYPATSLVVSTKLPSRGLKLRGHVVRDLPGSALDSLQLANEAHRPTSFSTYKRKELPLGQIVAGSARVKLEVREEPLR